MCLLIACREWSHLWRDKRLVFHINLRSDNNGALSVYSTLKGSSPGMNAIAREYALDTSENSFEPHAVSHLPGITNKVADVLSRRLDPKYEETWQIPEHLRHSRRVIPVTRNASWWRARKTPSSAYDGSRKGVLLPMQT